MGVSRDTPSNKRAWAAEAEGDVNFLLARPVQRQRPRLS
jgi:hypothetical protein